MKQKIQMLLKQLNHGLIERESTLQIALLTVLAGENLVLIGPPGTAKSLIARRIAESLTTSVRSDKQPDYFEYLLTKFSTPEEIFGPLSITALKADRFKRNTAGYLPTVKVAFLDEIFKASSSILNALLTILNERKYHNGSDREDVPMQALIAASNELPSDQDELSALYDRFLVRVFVDYVSQDKLPRLMVKDGPRPELTRLTTADLESINTAAESVTIPSDIVQAVHRIWILHKETFKEDRRESLSDRRLKKVIKLMKVSAATNGRTEVDLSDVFLLKDCLWNHQDNAVKVRDLILKTLQRHSRLVPQGIDTLQTRKTGEAVPKLPAPTSAKLGAVVKGFSGSGTEADPLLVQTVDDLADLSRADVGLKDYFFRQTIDIDCSHVSFWPAIPFKGRYDGGGYKIKTASSPKNTKGRDLFSVIHAKSRVANIDLVGFRLAGSAEDSVITECTADGDLTGNKVTLCKFEHCHSVGRLIHGAATGCIIRCCGSDSVLVGGTATECTIQDCLVVMNLMYATDAELPAFGGIAKSIGNGSIVERCFVSGTVKNTGQGPLRFSGIAALCNGSTIRNCAVGELQLIGRGVNLVERIAGSNSRAPTLINNATVYGGGNAVSGRGYSGITVAPALFKQRYFETNLLWDFDAVWQWDAKAGRPALRSNPSSLVATKAPNKSQPAKMVDLLQSQIRANIWLYYLGGQTVDTTEPV